MHDLIGRAADAMAQRQWRLAGARSAREMRSFLVSYSSELALYEKAVRFSELVLGNTDAKRFINAPHPELGLPENSFSSYREELVGTRDQARVMAGERYLDFLGTTFHGRTEARSLGVGWLWDGARAHERAIDELGSA